RRRTHAIPALPQPQNLVAAPPEASLAIAAQVSKFGPDGADPRLALLAVAKIAVRKEARAKRRAPIERRPLLLPLPISRRSLRAHAVDVARAHGADPDGCVVCPGRVDADVEHRACGRVRIEIVGMVVAIRANVPWVFDPPLDIEIRVVRREKVFAPRRGNAPQDAIDADVGIADDAPRFRVLLTLVVALGAPAVGVIGGGGPRQVLKRIRAPHRDDGRQSQRESSRDWFHCGARLVSSGLSASIWYAQSITIVEASRDFTSNFA